jgi:SET domain-containing protein
MDKARTIKFKNVIVELRPSKIAKDGVGVFAVTKIKKGMRVFEGVHLKYFNDLAPWTIYNHLPKSTQHKIMSFCVGTPDGFIPPDNYDFNSLSIEWYLNHSCDGNIGFDSVGDFIAIKTINPGDELAYDYGLVESNPKFRMRCNCKASNCRKNITGNDWQILKNDTQKSIFMHPYLKNKKYDYR